MSRQVDQTWIMKRGHSWHYFGIGLILFDIRNHTYYTWLVVWNMTFVTFHFIYGIILQFDSDFSEGLLKPPTSMDYNN
jgi:hypothetical protein